jgi:methenyltetrahydromethanopterin cyclohydrolase
MNLNELGLRRCEQLLQRATELNIAVLRDETGARIVDCGVHVRGGVDAGIALAEVCLAGLGRVDIVPGDRELWTGGAVTIRTDQPVAACMASQYAGWQVAGDKFFAMGSGPMRAVRGREELFEQLGCKESANAVVGVLEASKLPHEDVCHHLAAECRVEAENLTLLVAPTASLAGTIQVVARSVETALHKLHEVGFDISRVRSGFGVAPLPPVAGDDLVGIGRTNDAVLYGGEVTLWVDSDDDALREFGPQIPSSASPDHGQPFAEIFARYDRDFYKIDPMLFSPAVVTLNNVETGTSLRFGETVPQVIHQSFSS